MTHLVERKPSVRRPSTYAAAVAAFDPPSVTSSCKTPGATRWTRLGRPRDPVGIRRLEEEHVVAGLLGESVDLREALELRPITWLPDQHPSVLTVRIESDRTSRGRSRDEAGQVVDPDPVDMRALGDGRREVLLSGVAVDDRGVHPLDLFVRLVDDESVALERDEQRRKISRSSPDLAVPIELPEESDTGDRDGTGDDARDESVPARGHGQLRSALARCVRGSRVRASPCDGVHRAPVPSVQASSTSSAPNNSRNFFLPRWMWTRTVGIAVPIRCATSGTSRSSTWRRTIAARWFGDSRRSASISPLSSGGGDPSSAGAGPRLRSARSSSFASRNAVR